MRTKNIYILSVLTLFILGIACTKDDVDNSAPVINLIEPANEDSLVIGEDVHFECEFTDNVELKSYKVDIHYNDGHVHTKSGKLISSEEGHPFTLEQTWNFDEGLKNTLIHHHEIVIPDSVIGEEGVLEPVLKGEYHFGVYCTDVAGNESHVYIDVLL